MAKRTRTTDRPRKGTVISICAREGGGKTRWLLSLPKPLTIISVDPNTQAVVDMAVEEGAIEADSVTVIDIDMPALAFGDKDDVKAEAEESWNLLIETLRPITERSSDVRSVGFDTATEIDQLNVMAKFGKLDQISPEARRNGMGVVNRRYMGMIRTLQDRGVHVGLLHRVYDMYKTESVRTSQGAQEQRVKIEEPWAFERKGFKDTGYITQVELLLRHDETRSDKLPSQFGMKVVRATMRPALKGAEYWGREKLADGSRLHRASFAYLMAQLVPSTTPEDWL